MGSDDIVKRKRANYLLTTDQAMLRDWGRALYGMFHFQYMPYHVGSSLLRPDWRDVDVRVMVPDEVFGQIDAIVDVQRLNLALSLWGQKVTGLPIDCQVQPITDGNSEHGSKRRSAIGIDHDRHRHNEWEARRG